MNSTKLEAQANEIANELRPELENRGATCFEVAQWTYNALRKRGFSPLGVAGSKGHSFVIVGTYIVDLWESDETLKAKVWEIGDVPADQEPEAYLDPWGEAEDNQNAPESLEDDRYEVFEHEVGQDRGDLIDEGRSDGYGESYAERNT